MGDSGSTFKKRKRAYLFLLYPPCALFQATPSSCPRPPKVEVVRLLSPPSPKGGQGGIDGKEGVASQGKEEEEVYNNYPNIDNINPKKGVNYRVVCDIKGTRYKNIVKASRLTGESRICAKLNNNFAGYLTIEKIPYDYSAIIRNRKE